MSLDELKAAARRHDLLTHSFYQRWVAGELSIDELRDYAGQYAFIVEAIPAWLSRAAADRPERGHLEAHAVEEATHVEMWADFAEAIGVDRAGLEATEPNSATRELLATGDELAAQGLGAAVVWALEAQTPAVAAEKMDGLRRHYGIEAGARGGRYFELHRTLDVEHADELERVIETDPVLAAAAPAAADRALEGLWSILTSVERPAATVPA